MSDEREPSPPESGVGALLRAVEGLRDDVREDIGHLRDDMREDNAALEQRVMTALNTFAVTHGREHVDAAAENGAAHARFDAFIRSAEVAQARRDGTLGIFRFALEQLSRHSGAIVRVLMATSALVALASGLVHLQVVVT